jgi:hypothetical protein
LPSFEKVKHTTSTSNKYGWIIGLDQAFCPEYKL